MKFNINQSSKNNITKNINNKYKINKTTTNIFSNIKLSGLFIGLIEIVLFILISFSVRHTHKDNLYSINSWTYYWLMMTILTGFWELVFVLNYNNINKISQQLIENKETVWTNKYK